MRRWYVWVPLLAILLILAALLLATFGRPLLARLIAWNAQRQWDALKDFEADMRITGAWGRVDLSSKAHVWFKKPHYQRMELEHEVAFVREIILGENTLWITLPRFKRVLELSVKDEFVEQARENWAWWQGQDPAVWIEQALEDKTAKFVGLRKFDGRRCYVLDIAPQRIAESMRNSAERGATRRKREELTRTADQPEAPDIMRCRAYFDAKSGLPIKVTGITAGGTGTMSYELTGLKVNQKLSDELFQYTPPQDYKVIRRDFDPDRPWRTFLPFETDDIVDFFKDLKERFLGRDMPLPVVPTH